MPVQKRIESFRAVLSGAFALCSLAGLALAITTHEANAAATFLPTGLEITPTAAPGATYQALNPKLSDFPNFIASGALNTVKSPDGNTLLVVTCN